MIRLYLKYLKPYWASLLIVVIAQLAATMASLKLPSLNAQIIDQGVATGDTHRIWILGGWMLLVSLGQITGQLVAVWFGASAAASFGRDLRSRIFSQVLGFSSREVNKFGAPSLITRNTNDVQQLQQLVAMTCIMMISAPITMIGGVIQGVREAWRLSWLIVAAVVVLGVGIGILVMSVSPLFRKLQNLIDGLNRVLREQITGIRVVRAFVREDTEAQRFDTANSNIAAIQTRVGRFMATIFPFVMLVMNMSSVGVLWFGSHQIDAGKLLIGQQTAFLNYLMQILMSVMMTTMLVFMVPRAKICADRINEVLDTESTVVWSKSGRTDLSDNGHLRLTDVSFTYPGAEHPVLNKISFEVKPGEMTAIIGSTGSGKSTLVNLIPRLYDATSGTVEIDEIDVREADPDTLWAHVGLVPQKPYLFTGTIASNLRYGNPSATDEEIWRALDVAQAADFVREMPDGLDTAVAQGGTNVSGGQRQRLAIARALIKKPDIYIFDDSFSALDVATDARLRAALVTETRGAAVLIVAQRISTIMGADHIIVLEDGEIVGEGTHTELLSSNDTYQEIVESQFATQEVSA